MEIIRLRVENERLKTEVEQLRGRLRDALPLRLRAENERLRAELDTLTGSHRDLATRLADSGRELERLRAEIGRYDKARTHPEENDCCVAYRAEIERLRPIVERAATFFPACECTRCLEARAALTESKLR